VSVCRLANYHAVYGAAYPHSAAIGTLAY